MQVPRLCQKHRRNILRRNRIYTARQRKDRAVRAPAVRHAHGRIAVRESKMLRYNAGFSVFFQQHTADHIIGKGPHHGGL